MTDKLMPDEIWACDPFINDAALPYWHKQPTGGCVKYTRADLAAPTDAEVAKAVELAKETYPDSEAVQTLIRAATARPSMEVAEAAKDWIKAIIALPETMTFCGNFSEEYKAGSRDGMRAAAIEAEQALALLGGE